MSVTDKLHSLQKFFHTTGSVAVAFSAGVDSTLLLKVAHDVLGDNVIALTAASPFVPRDELIAAKNFCDANNIRHIVVTVDVLNLDAVADNPPNRCYICKRALFTEFFRVANENNFATLVEGSNVDDLTDYRPGLRALTELGVISPLRDVGLSKSEIRELSRALNLPTADKPAMACLATRFPFGERLTVDALTMVEAAENFLRDIGLTQLRVRVHGKLARIEIQPDDFTQLITQRGKVVEKFLALGFQFVTLDLQPFRSGSMNFRRLS